MPTAARPTPDGLPGTHSLTPAYPNPFNPRTGFTLHIADAQHVKITLIDVLGRRVATLQDGRMEAGIGYRFTVEGEALASGSYTVLVQGEHFADQLRINLVK